MSTPTHVLDQSLADIQRRLRDGSLSAVALVDAGEARHTRDRAGLGAYIERDAGLRLRQAQAADAAFAAGADLGPLHGVPVSVKDLYGVRGHATHAGSPRRLPPAWEREGAVVATVRRQLAVITGKTHTVEFAFGGLGANPHWPVPVNPWDAGCHRVPGGSSAGAGVSLHVDALVALGTDTAGSVRIPASMTGTVGMKTTWGRWPIDGIVPLSPGFDTSGLLTRTVADARIAFAAIDSGLGCARAGEPASLPPLTACRLGLCEQGFFDDCSPGVADSVRRAIAELTGAGARLEAIDLPELEPCLEIFRAGHLAAAELHELLHDELPAWLATLDPRVAARIGDAGQLSAYEYLRRRRSLAQLGAAAASHFDNIDVIVTPTVAVTPPALTEIETADAYRRCNMLALRNTAVANMLGLCAVSLPVGLDAAGMPVGLQLFARGGDDARLLAIAAACEGVLGTARERLGVPPRCRP
ncbi:MAG: amidase [Gammaproteobacteria bacterium]|nr:amidase [Gammaproteobacteria bacterium]